MEIEAFIAGQKMTAAEFGRRVVHDHKLVARLRSGKDMRLTTIKKVRDFISSNAEVTL